MKPVISIKNNHKTKTAEAVLAAFRYQLLQSLAGWLELKPGDRLFLERSEDFTVHTESGVLTDVQVKHTQAAKGPTPHSLRSPDVRHTLARFWDNAQGGTSDLRLHFISNGGAATEVKYTFPDEAPGLRYWRLAALDAETAPIRAALLDLFQKEPLGLWLASEPSDDELRQRLLRRVVWMLGSESRSEFEDTLKDAVAAYLHAHGFSMLYKEQVFPKLLDNVFQTACRKSPGERVLTSKDLHSVLEELASQIAQGNAISAARAEAIDNPPIQGLAISEVEASTGWFSHRPSYVRSILDQAVGRPVIWLYGAHGIGKSTLAQLLATSTPGRRLSMNLHGLQDDLLTCLGVWRELLKISISGVAPGVVIIDDPSEKALVALTSRISGLVQLMENRGGRIIITSNAPPTAKALFALGDQRCLSIQPEYFSQEEVLALVRQESAPPEDVQGAWAFFIRGATNGGHPQLTTAKILGLRGRGWPREALVEDIIGPKPSEAMRVERDQARRQLLEELTAFGPSWAADAMNLLRRASCVFGRLDEGLARRLISAPPHIINGGDALTVLRGAWFELLPLGDFQVSPLFSNLRQDLPDAEQKQIRSEAAEYWLTSGTLNERTLPLCFWNAFLGGHSWVLSRICELFLKLPEEKLASAATVLSPMVQLRTDQPLHPEWPIVGLQLRLIQFEISNAMQDGEGAGKIANTLLTELDALEPPEARPLMTSIVAQKVLGATHANTSPEVELIYALRLREVIPKVLELGAGVLRDPKEGIFAEYGGEVDVSAFMVATRLQRISSSDSFLRYMQALDQLTPELREEFFRSTRLLFKSFNIVVQAGWAADYQAERDMGHALSAYQAAEEIVSEWNIVELMIEIACAKSAIMDEHLDDPNGALAITEKAILSFGAKAELVRQKAKVLFHLNRHAEGLEAYLEIEDEIGVSEPLHRAMALRDGAVAAAKTGRYQDTLRFLTKAIDAAEKTTMRAPLVAGLLLDFGNAAWRSGDRRQALQMIAKAYDLLETLDAGASRHNQAVHQVARALPGYLVNDLEGHQKFAGSDIAVGKGAEIYSDNDPIPDIPLRPLSDAWQLLHLLEIRTNVNAGIEARSAVKRDAANISPVEIVIPGALYEREIVQGNTRSSLEKGIETIAVWRAAAPMTKAGGSLLRSDLAKAASVPVLEILADSTWSDALRRIPLELMLYDLLKGRDLMPLVGRLDVLCPDLFANDQAVLGILKVATGRYRATDKSPYMVHVAQAVLMPKEYAENELGNRWHRDFHRLVLVGESFAKDLLEPILIGSLAMEWQAEIEGSTDASIVRARPELEESIQRMPGLALAGAAQLLQAILPLLDYQLTDDWAMRLERIASGLRG